VLGRPLVEPDGRRARLTSSGVALVAEARRIIAIHDEALRRLAAAGADAFVIGATDHAADYILPPIVAALGAALPDLQVRFRFDRTAPLNEAVDRGSVDLAVFITEASTQPAEPVGSMPLVWSATPGWRPPPAGEPWPLIAIEAPCAGALSEPVLSSSATTCVVWCPGSGFGAIGWVAGAVCWRHGR
jgi:DNA-binding transcriptional LysR family regulator